MADLVFVTPATTEEQHNDDGLIFDGFPQQPPVPPDPTGEEWRGPQGEMGPPGVQGDPGKDGIDGSPGPPGPSAVSADAGNSATLGSDSLIYVPTTKSGATLTVADTPPTLSQGALWFDSISTSLFVGYVDPSGPPGQWVVANNSGSVGGPYVALSGSTMTGPLTLSGDPTTTLHAAPKRYVDNAINLAGNYLGTWSVAANSPNISAGGTISNANYVATTVVPGTPETVPAGVPGIAGMSVSNGDRIIWAAGLGVWQILRNAGVTLAAADARYYAITNPSGYQTAAQVATALAPYANNVGRNLLHNSMFNVAQRGTTFSATGYTVDRWVGVLLTDTGTFNRNSLVDADRAQIGDETASFCVNTNFTGNAAAGALTLLAQRIEGVRRVGGKTVTISFWAKLATGTPRLGVSLDQVFGTGGSPSASVNQTGTAFTLLSTWARYSITFALPSVAGMTLGTNSDDYTQLNFWFSSGATNNTRAGGIGVQSGNIAIWGVQLEIGSVATPLAKRDPADELALCQRFYQRGSAGWRGTVTNGWGFGYFFQLPVLPRAQPTYVVSNITSTAATSVGIGSWGPSPQTAQAAATATASGYGDFVFDWTASADL